MDSVQVRENDRSTPESARFLDNQILEKPLEGTKFCSLEKVSHNIKMDWDISPADHCCQALHRCANLIIRQTLEFGKSILKYKKGNVFDVRDFT